MNPCREYWGDILSDREVKKRVREEGSRETLQSLHLEKGNSLLASMGKMGREFFDILNEYECEEVPIYEEPGEGNLLSSLQSHILNLREEDREFGERIVVSEDDTSVQIRDPL